MIETIKNGVITKIDGCKQISIYPPKNFITYNFDKTKYKDAISVDECIADEIQELWNKGIHTNGCCCGHGKNGFIEVVDKDIKKMKKMGYVHYIYPNDPNRNDAFIPKSTCKNNISLSYASKPNTKINISENFSICCEKKFNWFNKLMTKLFFGWDIEDYKGG